jgi:hypothetical protein
MHLFFIPTLTNTRCDCRKSSSRALEELNRTIVDIETKFKAELGRLKKKYEGDFRELEIQIETLSRTNAELIKGNKSLVAKVKVRRSPMRSYRA